MTCLTDTRPQALTARGWTLLASFLLGLILLGLPAQAEGETRALEPGHSLGATDAPLTIVEYGSVTCSTCKYFHEQVLPAIKPDYIADGRVQFVFREFSRNDLDTEIMVLARCAGPENFFGFLDDAFASQASIREMAMTGKAEEALRALAARHGIESEDAFKACRNDFDLRFDVSIVKQSAALMGITGTPTFIINGKLVPWGPHVGTPEAFQALVDQELAKTASAGH